MYIENFHSMIFVLLGFGYIDSCYWIDKYVLIFVPPLPTSKDLQIKIPYTPRDACHYFTSPTISFFASVAIRNLNTSYHCPSEWQTHHSTDSNVSVPAVRSDLNGGLLTCLCFIMYQEYTVICIFDQMHVNLIWYLYPFMLNKICFTYCLDFNNITPIVDIPVQRT